MDLGLGDGAGDAEHPAALVGADADGREHGGIAHDPSLADLLVARVENQIADLAQGAGAPGFQLLVQELGGAADLARRQALQAELAHDGLGIAVGDAFDVHLGDRQHDGAAGAPAAFQGLRVEGRVMIGGLGNLKRHRAGWGIDLLGPGAVGVAAALGRALVVVGTQEPLALDAHGEIEEAGEDRGHLLAAAFDQLFHQGLKSTILISPHASSPCLFGRIHGKPR